MNLKDDKEGGTADQDVIAKNDGPIQEERAVIEKIPLDTEPNLTGIGNEGGGKIDQKASPANNGGKIVPMIAETEGK